MNLIFVKTTWRVQFTYSPFAAAAGVGLVEHVAVLLLGQPVWYSNFLLFYVFECSSGRFFSFHCMFLFWVKFKHRFLLSLILFLSSS